MDVFFLLFRNVVKSFYTAGMLFDVMQTFGELNEQVSLRKQHMLFFGGGGGGGLCPQHIL